MFKPQSLEIELFDCLLLCSLAVSKRFFLSSSLNHNKREYNNRANKKANFHILNKSYLFRLSDHNKNKIHSIIINVLKEVL